MFLDSMLYNDLMSLFESFFDNEPIEGRSCSIDDIFDLSIIDVNKEHGMIIFNLSMEDFATFTISLNLEEQEAWLVAYSDEEENMIFIDSDIGCACKELITNRLNIALDFFENNCEEEFEHMFENVEVFDYDTEILNKQDKPDDRKIKLIPKTTKKKISVDFGMGTLITKLVEKNIITLYSCIGHGKSNCYITMYCFDNEVEEVKNLIKESFDIDPAKIEVEIEQENEYWMPADDGRRHYYFSWK
jgi:hypothetical protein